LATFWVVPKNFLGGGGAWKRQAWRPGSQADAGGSRERYTATLLPGAAAAQSPEVVDNKRGIRRVLLSLRSRIPQLSRQ